MKTVTNFAKSQENKLWMEAIREYDAENADEVIVS